MPNWHPTDSCKFRGSGVVVERDGQLGYAKLDRLWREMLAACLAELVVVPVPRVEIDYVEGCGPDPFAISHIHSCRSRPLVTKEEPPRVLTLHPKVTL